MEALFSVVERDGLEQASLRNVAAEAGLALGSVRHYFDNHAELMVFAMKAMSERVANRLSAHFERLQGTDDRLEVAIDMLAEVLPLDAERRREVVVWLAFVNAARTHPSLRSHADEVYKDLITLATRIFEGGRRSGRLAPDVDVALEARRLCALLDGLSMDAILHPSQMDPETALAILRRHLTSLLVHSGR